MKTNYGRASGKQNFYFYRRFVFVIVVSTCVPIVLASASGSSEQQSRPSKSESSSSDGIWRTVDAKSLTRLESSSPRYYQAIVLNRSTLTSTLSNAPMEFTEVAKRSRVIVSLPMPDGTFKRFAVEESPAMAPELAAQFPEIKSYRGQGIDDPTATTRFDLSPIGFHAVILSAEGSVYVEPYTTGDNQHYLTYFKEQLQDGFTTPRCEVSEELQGSLAQGLVNLPAASVGASLRTYRLALATTVEYTNNATYGGGKAGTLTKLNTIVNLINAIYEREVSIRFQLVAGELSIIFDAEPDGYTNGNVSTMLNENQGVLNTQIGSGNYDIGHVFGLSNPGSSSGIAQIAVVCTAAEGAGASVLGIALVTGNFSIDSGLVAHEWGHQFSARHTFNSLSGNCGLSGQRSSTTSFEPGSGSTLMAYPGSCSPENLQQNGDNYFHGGSFNQIANYDAGTGAACAAITPTGNNPPTVTAGPDFTIPAGTPFTLTASATDPDGDPLTYSWEELDLGNPSPPMTDDGTRPLFRSFNPVTSASRTFPKVSDILNNTSTIGELLPTTTRSMNFRVTARDNRATSGGVNSDSMVLNVTSLAGPFVVSSPNSSVTWTGNTTQTVTWNVANTTSSPVNCTNVKISLSTDGGNTFPVVLSASTANDGSEPISVPNIPTNTARIKVEAVGNVFFDISNSNFTIAQGSGASGVDTIGLYAPANAAFFLRNSNTGGVADTTFTYGPAGSGLIPLVGDWNGDGVDTIGLYSPANAAFFLRNSNTGGVADITFTYGPAGMGLIPLVGDWNGDGIETIGLYSPAAGAFFLRNSNSGGIADITFTYGPAGTGLIPLVGDWDGDGVDTIGLYNPANAAFFLRNSNTGGVADITFTYGPAGLGLIPLVGDWNGDGIDTIGLYNPSGAAFFLRNTNSGGIADITFTYGPAGLAFKPLVGDWNGL